MRETVTARWQHYLVLLRCATIGMLMTIKTEQLLQNGGAPEYMYHDRTAWRCAVFVGKDMVAKAIRKEMLPMYGEHCLSRQAVHNWVQKFSEGRTSIEDEHRVGWPVEIATPATLQRVEDLSEQTGESPSTL